MKMFWVTRHLNTNLDSLFEQALRLDDPLAKQIRQTTTLSNSIPGSTIDDLRKSFRKYNKRLQQRGIKVPQEITSLEQQLTS